VQHQVEAPAANGTSTNYTTVRRTVEIITETFNGTDKVANRSVQTEHLQLVNGSLVPVLGSTLVPHRRTTGLPASTRPPKVHWTVTSGECSGMLGMFNSFQRFLTPHIPFVIGK